jgi:hypothetical protein
MHSLGKAAECASGAGRRAMRLAMRVMRGGMLAVSS